MDYARLRGNGTRAILDESDSVSEFTERLKREWTIETGLIERLYTLDRGITELMIQHGVNAALIPHSAGELLDRTRFHDHRQAQGAIFGFIEGWYNPHRRHQGLGYYSPMDFERPIKKLHETQDINRPLKRINFK